MKPIALTGLLVTVLALAVPHAAGQALNLDYSTYFEHNGTSPRIVVDAAGDVYVSGVKKQGGGFVAKLTLLETGEDGLVWITFLQDNRVGDLALDSAGNVYVFSRSLGGGTKYASVAWFDSATGNLEHSEVIGQAGAQGIAIHETGTQRFVYVTGGTGDPQLFPSTGRAHTGANDAYVVKFEQIESPPRLDFVDGTFLGGSDVDTAIDIAVDGMGNAYVTGVTQSPDLFTTLGAYQTLSGGANDAFVAKVNFSAPDVIEYSTYLAGSEWDQGFELAVDGMGHVYVTGHTQSPNFPVTIGSFDEGYNDTASNWGWDLFVAKLDPSKSGDESLVASTYLGGSDADRNSSIALDGSGVLVAASTSSSDFPTRAGALDFQLDGASDIVLAKLSLDLTTLLNSTYFGGSKGEGARLAVDTAGSIHLSGNTGSSDFPTTPGAFMTVNPAKNGGSGFMSKMSFGPAIAGVTVSPTSGLVTTEGGGMDSFTVVLNTEPTFDVTIGISSSNTGEGTVSTSSLIFTSLNWFVEQTVTVTGQPDGVIDPDVAYTLITAPAVGGDYAGLDAEDVFATNLDIDAPPPPAINVDSISPTPINAGDTNVPFTVLGSGFQADASISFENGSGPAPQVGNITVLSDTQIGATISVSKGGPKGSRLWDVRVTNPDSSTDVLPGALTVLK